MTPILQKYHDRVAEVESLLCVGLDSDFSSLPPQFQAAEHPQFAFNKWIIDQTHDLVVAYKPNIAFYEARGVQGWNDLQLTIEYLRSEHPEILTILDAKRADIDSTNQGYVTAFFDELGFDAVTLHPYLGQEALRPFLDRTDKACIILCKTSNVSGGEFQDLQTVDQQGSQKPLWETVAERVIQTWNQHQNCMLVVGATYPQQMARIRELSNDMVFLVPGVGKQGGKVEDLKAGLNTGKTGLIVNSSRSIIFASDPRMEATKLRTELNSIR